MGKARRFSAGALLAAALVAGAALPWGPGLAAAKEERGGRGAPAAGEEGEATTTATSSQPEAGGESGDDASTSWRDWWIERWGDGGENGFGGNENAGEKSEREDGGADARGKKADAKDAAEDREDASRRSLEEREARRRDAYKADASPFLGLFDWPGEGDDGDGEQLGDGGEDDETDGDEIDSDDDRDDAAAGAASSGGGAGPVAAIGLRASAAVVESLSRFFPSETYAEGGLSAAATWSISSFALLAAATGTALATGKASVAGSALVASAAPAFLRRWLA